jgi:hypothetical protein
VVAALRAAGVSVEEGAPAREAAAPSAVVVAADLGNAPFLEQVAAVVARHARERGILVAARAESIHAGLWEFHLSFPKK